MQQILLLPKVGKALILCNNTLSFYSLPELSRDTSAKPLTCSWVGGVDLNAEDDDGSEGVVVMLGLKSKLRLIKISEDDRPQALRTIEYGGCLKSVRRDNFSCAADSHSYALLDLERQQKIGLFPISSLDADAGDIGGAAEDIASTQHGPARSTSSASIQPGSLPRSEPRAHGRSSSLGVFGAGGPASLRTESPRPPAQRYGFDVPESLSRSMSPAIGRSPGRSPARSPVRDPETQQHPERTSSLSRASTPAGDKPLPPPPEEGSTAEQRTTPPPQAFVPLKPHVASPSPAEFLLTVGTTPSEPGVGMFVNLDGDMCRGSIQFSSYPDAVIVDGTGIDLSASLGPGMDAEEGYVLAVVHRKREDQTEYEIGRAHV